MPETVKCFGRVIAQDSVPIDGSNPNLGERLVWRVRNLSPGKYYKRRVTIDRNRVPKGIAVDVMIEFDLDDVQGDGVHLIARQAELQQRDRKDRTERTGTNGHQQESEGTDRRSRG